MGYASRNKKARKENMEIWKEIPGYEGLYEASDSGRIRTCEGKTTSNSLHPSRVWKRRILSPKKHHTKYGRTDYRVDLWKGNSFRTYLVARLIALTFCEGYFEKATVNHINGDSSDNRAENLEWVPLKSNINHAFDTGLYSTSIPIRLTDENNAYLDFRSMTSASKYMGRNAGYVQNKISKGEYYGYSVDNEYFGIAVAER